MAASGIGDSGGDCGRGLGIYLGLEANDEFSSSMKSRPSGVKTLNEEAFAGGMGVTEIERFRLVGILDNCDTSPS